MAYGRLMEYLRIKIHHLIDEQDWSHIVVTGSYNREGIVSAKKKNDKLFNWQRPTARVEGTVLVVECFPGLEYVHHYALIIATYLSMTGRYRGQVSYLEPSEQDCRDAITHLTERLDGEHLVIVGWGLTHLCQDAEWSFGDGHAWARERVAGRRVLYLGYQHSIWGDAAGRVVTRLAELGARRVVYVGKVGALDPGIEPNTTLATGNTSIMSAGPVRWRDYFADVATGHPTVIRGTHVSSPSILLEGQEWVRGNAGRQFVDPEIGHMGAAASAADIEFGYLHVISNNLARRYSADLSNERQDTVLRRRARLLQSIAAIIRRRVEHSANSPRGHSCNLQRPRPAG